jgi:hypothetical protein
VSSWVEVVLDTIPPSLTVGGSQAAGNPSLLNLQLESDDAVELRIWGEIDPTDPLNSRYAETEEAAEWFDFEEAPQVRLAPGTSTVYVQVRDDVWNELPAQALTLTVSDAPVVRPPRGAGPYRQRQPRRSRETHTVSRSRSTLRLQSRDRSAGTHRTRSEVTAYSGFLTASHNARSRSTLFVSTQQEIAAHARTRAYVHVETGDARMVRLGDARADIEAAIWLDII